MLDRDRGTARCYEPRLNLPGSALAASAHGLGFYSFLYRHMYGAENNIHVARLERLATELPAAMARAAAPAPLSLTAWLREAAPRNASRHIAPCDAYDPALAALVMRHEAPIIRRFGYALHGSSAAAPVRALRAAPTST